ncbi:MAG TPA: type II toxin-antitoxin system RelB/DinJ family antitoxin [Rhodospirillaceae bacterium]|nr:type II toxin-antitoxin system RelB/DinJ family antitoxin [Rhodospirillaceae bacterium]
MATDTVVRARIDLETKNQATAALAAMGLSISDYIRMALVRVARDQAVPFEVKVPNAETRAAMEEARSMGRARYSSAADLIDDLEKKRR